MFDSALNRHTKMVCRAACQTRRAPLVCEKPRIQPREPIVTASPRAHRRSGAYQGSCARASSRKKLLSINKTILGGETRHARNLSFFFLDAGDGQVLPKAWRIGSYALRSGRDGSVSRLLQASAIVRLRESDRVSECFRTLRSSAAGRTDR